MTRGYTHPLYLLPFDHRHSYITGMYHFEPALTREHHAAVTDTKQVTYEGFQNAVANGLPHGRITRDEAVARIAQRYQEWATIFEKDQP